MCYLCTQAARNGQEDLLEHFLEHCMKDQIDALDKEGYAALHYAVKHHRVNIIKKLLTAKCGKLGTKCTIHIYASSVLALWNKCIRVVAFELSSQPFFRISYLSHMNVFDAVSIRASAENILILERSA